MKNLALIVTLTAIATSFAAQAENYTVKNKPALIVSSTSKAVTTRTQPVQVVTQKRTTYSQPAQIVYTQPQVEYVQPVYQQQQYEQRHTYTNQQNYAQPELSYAIRNQDNYYSGRRGDILGEVIEVKRAPKKCEPTVKHEGTNTVLSAIVGGVLGNQIGDGSGRDIATVSGVLIGGAVGNKHNRENRGKVECEGRGYLITVAYVDAYGQVQYHTVRSDRRERKGDLLNIERY